MQALTLDHAKGLLRDSASILDAALDSGLSGRGGCTICSSPTRRCRRANGKRRRRHDVALRISSLAVWHRHRDRQRPGPRRSWFADPGDEPAALADMQRRWPRASYVEDRAGTARWRSVSSIPDFGGRTSRCAWC